MEMGATFEIGPHQQRTTGNEVGECAYEAGGELRRETPRRLLVESWDWPNHPVSLVDEELSTACVSGSWLQHFDEVRRQVTVGIEQERGVRRGRVLHVEMSRGRALETRDGRVGLALGSIVDASVQGGLISLVIDEESRKALSVGRFEHVCQSPEASRVLQHGNQDNPPPFKPIGEFRNSSPSTRISDHDPPVVTSTPDPEGLLNPRSVLVKEQVGHTQECDYDAVSRVSAESDKRRDGRGLARLDITKRESRDAIST